MSTIRVNNQTFFGNNVIVSTRNGVTQITVDGKVMETPDLGVKIDIKVDGALDSLQVENANSIVVNGPIFKGVESRNGNITCQDVTGDITNKNGNISCGKVSGSVTNKNGNIKHG